MTAVAEAPKTLPTHDAPLPVRMLRAAATPGGAVFVLVGVLLIADIIANPNFADPEVLTRFAGRTAAIAIAAMGQYYVIVSGEFDLSMAAVIAAQVVLAGNFIGQDESMIVPGLLVMLGVGVLIGVVNGLATTILKVPSFIVTLGTMLALTGLVRYITGGAATGNPSDAFRQIGRGGIEDVPVIGLLPYPLIILVIVAVFSVWLMSRPFGRTLIAVGDNAEAARYAGTAVWWVKTRAFILSAVSATIAGVLLVGYAGVHPSVGSGYEFSAITAVVLGGVVLGGGRGWVLSAAAGAYALELLFLLLTNLEVESTWRDTVQGVIIIVAVALGARTWQRRGRKTNEGPAAPPTDSSPPTNQPDLGTITGDK